ncbi:MAG: carboxypeptidase-like regulatory domain-containing protein [Flavobacteriaceae bacterium]
MKSIKTNSTLLFFLLTAVFSSGQQFSDLEGRITSTDNDVAGTHVMNISTQRATTTDLNGFFSIPVRLNDTLVFSAVQFKKKEIVVSMAIMESSFLIVPLEDNLTELDEVVVRPYNLSGELGRDMGNQSTEPVVTASTLGLPNAYVKVKTQNERRLFEADNGKFIMVEFDTLFYLPMVMINLNKILNRVSGRTQKIKTLIAIDKKIALLDRIRSMYPDSIYVQEFKIPEKKLNEFFYFCEADSLFALMVDTNDQFKIYEFLKNKSDAYRANNE